MARAWLDISAGIFEAPGAVMDPMYYPQGWNTYTRGGGQKARHHPGHHQPYAARPRLLREDPGARARPTSSGSRAR